VNAIGPQATYHARRKPKREDNILVNLPASGRKPGLSG
jgi:hypothetical protein